MVIQEEHIRKDKETILYRSIIENLKNGSEIKAEKPPKDYIAFTDTINQIINNADLKILCENNPEFSEKIAFEILTFINKTKNKFYNLLPDSHESELISRFHNLSRHDFSERWHEIMNYLKNSYNREEFDLSLYEESFSSKSASLNEKHPESEFEEFRKHFIQKWEWLYHRKNEKFELDIIDQERKIFLEDIYFKISQLKEIQKFIAPFSRVLGRLWDMSMGNWQKVSFDLLRCYAGLAEKDQSIRELAEMLGRMRLAEKEFEEELFKSLVLKPGWKVDHAGKSELVGIRESDDLGNMLPSETALLADQDLEPVFYEKFAEKKLLTFDYQARSVSLKEEEITQKRKKEKDSPKGPFIICVDTSGSMHGTPENIAKVLCFAILKLAVRDNRKCYLISFSTEIQTLDLADLRNSLEKLAGFLSMSFYGGTDAVPAMKESLKMINTNDFKKADVIMVSDFIMPDVDSATREQVLKAKENQTRFHSLVIGQSLNKQLASLFDHTWIFDPGNHGNMLHLVKNLNESF